MAGDALFPDETEQLVLSDLLNRVLDKGVVIAGDATISVAGVDLVRLNLTVVLQAVESEARRLREAEQRSRGGDASVLPPPERR
jgi:hypothetical protein